MSLYALLHEDCCSNTYCRDKICLEQLSDDLFPETTWTRLEVLSLCYMDLQNALKNTNSKLPTI